MVGLQLSMAEKIVLVRRRLGQTQEKFGERFNVKQLTVTHWEKGTFAPTGEHLAQMTRLFQDVLGEEDESQFETAAQQLLLPFDQPVKIEFHVSRLGPDRVRFGVQIRRRVI